MEATHENVTAIAKQRLQTIIEQGPQKTASVLAKIRMPTDQVVQASGMATRVVSSKVLISEAGGLYRNVHKHAVAQLFQRLDIPAPYAHALLTSREEWKTELLRHTLAEHAKNSKDRYLVRTVGEEVRGILSDRFRRLDSEPLLKAFVEGVTSVGGILYEGLADDLRVSVRAIIPQIVEPVPGEAMVFGLHWQNSDFGAGTYSVNAYAMRLVCLNGMLGESQIKQIHLGKRLDDNLQYSQRTYELDTAATASATRDTVRALLGPAVIARKVDAIRRAHAETTDFATAFKSVGKLLGKEETAIAKRHFEGSENIMLPRGNTRWRFSNVLSWMANSAEDQERKLCLQEAADRLAA